MKKEVTTQNGRILSYEESFWLGKRKIMVDNQELTKKSKNTFTDGFNDYIIKGNQFFGLTIEIVSDQSKEVCVILEKLSVIEIIICCLPLIMIFIGGAIGGFLGALGFFTLITICRKTKSILLTTISSIILSIVIYLVWLVASLLLLMFI